MERKSRRIYSATGTVCQLRRGDIMNYTSSKRTGSIPRFSFISLLIELISGI